MEEKDIKEVALETKSYIDTQTTTLAEQLKKAEAAIVELQKKANRLQVIEAGKKSFGDFVVEKLGDNQAFSNFADGQSKAFTLKLNTKNENLTNTNSIAITDTAPSTAYLSQRSVFGFGYEKLNIRDLVSYYPAPDGVAHYIRATAKLGVFSGTTQGQTIPQQSFDYESVTVALPTVSGFFRVANQILRYQNAIAKHIDSDGLKEYFKSENDIFVNGTNGLWNSATQSVYSGATVGGLITSAQTATSLDRIAGAFLQVRNTSFTPDRILVSPTDAVKLRLLKDSQNRYQFSEVNGILMFMGVPILEHTTMYAGNCLVFDSSQVEVQDGDNITISFSDSEGNNFVQNMTSIKIQKEAILIVKQAQAVVKVSI